MVNAIRALLVSTAMLLASFHASAGMITYDFYKLTNTNGEDLGIGGSNQLSITLWSYDEANATAITDGWANYVVLNSTQVLFTVQNAVGIASNISEIYFDDGLLGPSLIMNSLTGTTNFTGGGANPGNLPGGSLADPVFQATTQFSADVNPGPPNNGINAAADMLGIYLGLGSYADFDAVVAAVGAGDLRFGLHVRSIGAEGGSDSYVSPPDTIIDPPPPVPVPGTVLLMGLGLLLLATARSRRTRLIG